MVVFIVASRYNAARGDVQAQSVVGQLYYQGGHGLQQDYDEAFRNFNRVKACCTAEEPSLSCLRACLTLSHLPRRRNMGTQLVWLSLERCMGLTGVLNWLERRLVS